MKKLTTSILLILGLSIYSFQSNAASSLAKGSSENRMGNPRHIFKEVVNVYNTASGSFLKLSKEKQTEFIAAAEAMKGRILSHPRRDSEQALQRIDVTVNVFKFVWDSKSHLIAIEDTIEIPEAPALD